MNDFQRRIFPFILIFIFFDLGIISSSYCQSYPFHPEVFKTGEELTYVIRYGFFQGGEASLKVVNTRQDFHGNPAIHFLALGKTSGTLDIFYKVRNQYESYINPSSFLPYAYIENIKENKYTRSGTTQFDYDKKLASNKNGHYIIKDWTRDIVSAYYFARSIDVSNLKVGDKFTLSYFLEDATYPLEIQYLGREKVRSPTGTYWCQKYSPSIEPGRIFRKNSKIYLWITDDENHIPIKAKADILVGSIILELKEFRNLNKPLLSLNVPE